MGKNKKYVYEEQEYNFKRIKEQRKPIKNFKAHLKQMTDIEKWNEDEESIYNREWR